MARLSRIKRYLNTLTGRMALGVLMIHVLLIPLLFIGVLYITKQGYEDQFVNHVRTDAHLFSRLVSQDMGKERLEKLAQEAILSGRVVSVEILDPAKRPIATAGNYAKNKRFKEDFFFGQHDDSAYYVSLPLIGLDGAPTGTIRLGYGEGTTQEEINLAYRRGLYLALAYILLSFGLVAFIGPALTKPLRQLRRISRKIADGHFEEELNVNTSLIELQSLSEDLNHMRAKLVKQAATLEHQALHDALTGLPNRALLQDRMSQASFVADRNTQMLALLLIDLDDFKEINDTFGHAVGDLVLQKVAVRLRQSLRESDTVARLGGDEFAAIIFINSAESTKVTAEKIVEAIQTPCMIENQSLQIGASIGIAFYPDHGKDFDDLLRKADIAMYESKRNRVDLSVYEPNMKKHSLSLLTLGSELRSGIEHDEFLLHYQPKIDIATGAVRGVEALMRWQHPKRGLLDPNDFISVTEKTGLIIPLTHWLVIESFKQWSSWLNHGIEVNLAINLSARCLQDEHLWELIAGYLNKHNTAHCHLTLELTESVIMADPIHANEIFSQLHKLGVRLSIDDFGTGYSSLAYLKRLPVSEIKIDKSFVIDMLDDENDAAIVETIITLAHSFGITVIAEGVENKETMDKLEKLRCDLAQGYYISKPVTANEFIRWYDSMHITDKSRFRHDGDG